MTGIRCFAISPARACVWRKRLIRRAGLSLIPTAISRIDRSAPGRHLAALAPGNVVVPLEDAGTWATGLAIVGRPE